MWLTTVQCHACPVKHFYQECQRQRSTFTYICPVGSVINILSATAEVRSRWGQCSKWASPTCTRSIINHSAIVSCNGQRACSFGPHVLNYPQDNIPRLCNDHEDGNFVNIQYNCITSKKQETLSLLLVKMFDNSWCSVLPASYVGDRTAVSTKSISEIGSQSKH